MKRNQLLPALAIAAIAGLAQGATIDFSHPTQTQAVGSVTAAKMVFGTGSFSITAYGFDDSNHHVSLFAKCCSFDETGLGIKNENDHEISNDFYVQLDLGSIIDAGIKNLSLTFQSVQSGEGYAVYGSNTLGSMGSKLLLSGSLDRAAVSLPQLGPYKYVSITAMGGNDCSPSDILISSAASTTLSVSSVPEPATYAMMGCGMLLLGCARRKRLS